MKKITFFSALLALTAAITIWSCKSEDSLVPNESLLASQYTSLTLNDPFDLPNPAISEKMAFQLFDLKENDGKLTRQEVLTIGDPAQSEDLVYALLFVEQYDRDEILWSWDEPADEDNGGTDDRSSYGAWKWTGGDPIVSFWCIGFHKWPAFKVKNRFTDPCGETLEFAAVYKCCYSLCDADLPISCQSGCTNPAITIPAGSVDALAQAIEDVCTNGTIILAAGEHIENEGIVISKQVTIKGDDGAVLKINSLFDAIASDAMSMDVALHILNVERVRIENLEIVPLQPEAGSTAILVQNANKSNIINNTIQNHQLSIIVEKSNKVTISGNTILSSDGWLTGVMTESEGIIIINGEKAIVNNNEVSSALLGIWMCDKDGKASGNNTYGNYIGMILCNVPQYMELPNGTITGSLVPGTKWKVHDNVSQNNFDAGYLVIDGANNNVITNNEGGNNATYDFDLVGDSYRFGFLSPTSFNNTLNVGSFSGVTVKDCGNGNTVNGNATIIDTSVPGNECF